MPVVEYFSHARRLVDAARAACDGAWSALDRVAALFARYRTVCDHCAARAAGGFHATEAGASTAAEQAGWYVSMDCDLALCAACARSDRAAVKYLGVLRVRCASCNVEGYFNACAPDLTDAEQRLFARDLATHEGWSVTLLDDTTRAWCPRPRCQRAALEHSEKV